MGGNNYKSEIFLETEKKISYKVSFVGGVFEDDESSPLLEYRNRQLILVVDSKVDQIYGHEIDDFFKRNDFNFSKIKFDSSEENKTMAAVLEICSHAKEVNMKRDGLFVGIGGGITLDVLGFAASMFRRKSNYIRIPTTLIGMVDAGVGVKVGVNLNGAKNLIGSYYEPIASYNDLSFISTLEASDIRSGLYEIVKMALCECKDLFEKLEMHFTKFLNKELDENVKEISIVASDLMMKKLEKNLFEVELKRKVDFGHTFSPYIEESSNFKVQHGEAVGVDLLISSHISFQRGYISHDEFDRIHTLLNSIGGIDHFNVIEINKLHESLDRVRAHRAGNLNLVVPKGIGDSLFIQDVTIEELNSAVEFGINLTNPK